MRAHGSRVHFLQWKEQGFQALTSQGPISEDPQQKAKMQVEY